MRCFVRLLLRSAEVKRKGSRIRTFQAAFAVGKMRPNVRYAVISVSAR
jgi:hypothetical protein